MDKDQIEEALEALNVRAYVAQGRKLERLSDEDLAQHWVASFVAWAAGDEASGGAENDARAEMSLRGMEVPVEKLGVVLRAQTPEMEAIRTQLLELYLAGEQVGLLDELAEQTGTVKH